MKWFVTTSFPGGEFAVMAANVKDAFDAMLDCHGATEEQFLALTPSAMSVRAAPPDLVDWLDDTDDSSASLWKVPGGWVRYAEAGYAGRAISLSQCFVPVRSAAGITVIKPKEHEDAQGEEARPD